MKLNMDIPKCTCLMPSKKTFHQKLYMYGVINNICRITSVNSKKKVEFVCNLCYEVKEEQLCNVFHQSGNCIDCLTLK